MPASKESVAARHQRIVAPRAIVRFLEPFRNRR